MEASNITRAQELLHASSKREEVRDCINASTSYKEFLYQWDNLELTYSTGYKPAPRLYTELLSEYTVCEGIDLTHWLEIAKKVVEKKQALLCSGMTLDLWSASLLVQVHGKLSEANKEKFARMSLKEAHTVALRLLEKSKNA